MRTDVGKLVEAVNRVGISNVSLLSRMTGMPNETVRYVLKKRFPDLALHVQIHVDYAKLGLEQYYARLKLKGDAYAAAPRVLDAFSNEAFLTYYAADAADFAHAAIFSVPVAKGEEFRELLRIAEEAGVIEGVQLHRLEWARIPELKSRYYDFSSRTWKVDWKKVSADKEVPPAVPVPLEPEPVPDVDSMDLLLLKELQLDAWRNLAEIARKVGRNERTIRWHFKHHVERLVNAHYVRWLPVHKDSLRSMVGCVCEFGEVSRSQREKARRLFNAFPFTWFEAGNDKGYYQTQLGIPAGEFPEAMAFLRSGLRGIVQDWKVTLLDISSSCYYVIPYRHYDEEKSWFFDAETALDAIIASVRAKKTRPAA